MKEWLQNRNKIIRNEVIIIIFAVIILLFGVTINIFANKGFNIEKGKWENISSVLLPIQGTLITITVAVVALLSGFINESCMGVSISSYYLEKRPFVLKYKFIIILEFFLLVDGVLLHIFSLYFVVFAIFVVTLLFILVSIFEVFVFFNGIKGAKDEIEEYVDYSFQNGNDYLKLGDQFIVDWKKNSTNQTTEEFETHINMFFKLIDRLLLSDDIKNANSFSENVALFLLRDFSKSNQIKGLIFVGEFYNHICEWMDSNLEEASSISSQIHLIDRIGYDWFTVFSSFDSETIERTVNFRQLSENIIRVASSIGYDEKKSLYETNMIQSLGGLLGEFINNQSKKEKSFNLVRWEYILDDYYLYFISGISDKTRNFYCESLAIRDFYICKGYMLNEKIKLVKNAIFLDSAGKLYSIKHQSVALRIMLIHGFMYYLAFRESTDCIDDKKQTEIKRILLNPEVVYSIGNFYYHLSEEPHNITSELEDKFESILEKNEIYPIHSDGKELIIENVAREYYLFVVLFAARYTLQPEKMVEVLDLDKYQTYLSDSRYETLRENFIEAYNIFDDTEKVKERQIDNTDEMLLLFRSVMKKKYKRNVIIYAEQSQKTYEDNKIQEKIVRELKESILDKTKIFLEPFNKPVKRTKKYKRINVYTCLDYTIGLERDFGRPNSNYPFGIFVDWLINELSVKYGLKTVERNKDFKTDEEFREFLLQNKYNCLFGSQYPFDCKDYLDCNKHNEFLNDQMCIFVPHSKKGLATKDGNLFIQIDDVNVEIISPSINNLNITKDIETGLYIYSPLGGVKLEFEEKELEEILHNERKIISIYFDATIGIKIDSKKKNAVVITRKAFLDEIKDKVK